MNSRTEGIFAKYLPAMKIETVFVYLNSYLRYEICDHPASSFVVTRKFNKPTLT